MRGRVKHYATSQELSGHFFTPPSQFTMTASGGVSVRARPASGSIARVSATRPQHERRFGVLLDERRAERVREILLCRPQLREVVEVGAAGLARLAGSARADRAIPI